MADLSTITADIVDWLADQPLDELPPIVNIHVHHPHCMPERTVLQLFVRDGLRTAAAWAEHLGTTATVRRYANAKHVEARITTLTPMTREVELWAHLEAPEWQALEATMGSPITTTPVNVTAETLRQAAEVGEP